MYTAMRREKVSGNLTPGDMRIMYLRLHEHLCSVARTTDWLALLTSPGTLRMK